MRFIGDVHRKFGQLTPLITKDSCLQVGDMMVGYPQYTYPKVLPPNFRFIRGNKDNPSACYGHPNYLGDCGYLQNISLFYLSGAWSINWRYLTRDYDFWSDEELGYEELAAALEMYRECKPTIMVSHECPDIAFNEIFNRDLLPTRTSSALGIMLEHHQPDYWFFGHYHNSKEKKVGKTNFVCIGELDYYDVPGLEFDLPFTGFYNPLNEVEEIKEEDMEYVVEISPDQLALPGF
jgi:predicted phosphodiesterase